MEELVLSRLLNKNMPYINLNHMILGTHDSTVRFNICTFMIYTMQKILEYFNSDWFCQYSQLI